MILEKGQLIHLFNKNISYCIHINEDKYLETIYFGKYVDIENNDYGNIRTHSYQQPHLGDDDYTEVYNNDGFRMDCSLYEVAVNGRYDKRGYPIEFNDENKRKLADFKYISHEIYKGIKPIKNMPSADRKLGNNTSIENPQNVDTVEFILKNVNSEVYLKLYISIYNDKNIIIKNYSIINNTDNIISLTKAMSMQLDLIDDDYKLHHFYGRWGEERREEIVNLNIGNFSFGSNRGFSSHHENPFFYLTKNDTTYDKGIAIGFNFIYSGNFKASIIKSDYNSLRILYGINDEDFNIILNPKEEFVTPQAVISYSANGIDEISQSMHSFIKDNLINYRLEKEYRPIIFNSWEGCFFDFNTESIISYAKDAKKIGVELFVLDDGWFGLRNDDTSGLGDWKVNKDKIDLKKVIDEVHKLGMKFGIWFEPEMVNPNSELFKAHPEFALIEKGSHSSLSRHQLHLDFTNDEVIDNIFNQMKKILDEYEIDYIKRDHNRTVDEHFSSHLPLNRQGEVYHRLCLGYYKLIEKIRLNYPNIFIEGCKSGGGRFDLGTLYYCPQIWASDNTDPVNRNYIQFNTSLGYPLSTISSHVSAAKSSSYKTKSDLALFGTYGYEMNPNKLKEEEIKILNDHNKIYKEFYEKVINNGKLYHILSPENGNFMSMEAVSKDEELALMILFSKKDIFDKFLNIKLKGLNENYYYRISLDNKVYKGNYLMNVGLNLLKAFSTNETLLIEIRREK